MVVEFSTTIFLFILYQIIQMKKLLLFLIVCSSEYKLYAQAASYTDPAQAYLRLALEKNDGGGETVRVGTYKVMGTPYLFGEQHKSSIYTKDGNATNVKLSYNTYNQQIEVYNEGHSFYLQPGKTVEFSQPLFFVGAAQIGSTEKCIFQVVSTGKKYNLYKKYKSELGYVSTNYVQSELRQFDLNFEYYYTDNQQKTAKRLKLNSNTIKKEFKAVKDITAYVEDESFTNNTEFSLIKLFLYLNE